MGTSRLFPELIFLCVMGHSPHHPSECHPSWVTLKAVSANTCWHLSECSLAAPAQLILNNKTRLQMAEPEWEQDSWLPNLCPWPPFSWSQLGGHCNFLETIFMWGPTPSSTQSDTCCTDRLGFIVSLNLEWLPSAIHLLSHSHLESKPLKSEGLAPALPFCPKHYLPGLVLVPHRMQAGAMGLPELVKLLCTIPHAWPAVEHFGNSGVGSCGPWWRVTCASDENPLGEERMEAPEEELWLYLQCFLSYIFKSTSRELCWAKKVNSKRLCTVLFHSYDLLDMTELQQ